MACSVTALEESAVGILHAKVTERDSDTDNLFLKFYVFPFVT
jgi:hypothetical protein